MSPFRFRRTGRRRVRRAYSAPLAALAVLLSALMATPPEIAAQGGERAGQVSRMIPQVRIVRGTQQITGAENALVQWNDLVNTQRDGRARIALDDGSVLNVGSDSSLKITQYNPASQQTQIDLAYGQMRSKVAKITQPAGKFEVHTPVGVAGVVGTDFYLAYQDGMLRLVVFEGQVQFCNLAGVCALVAAGMISAIRGANQSPDSPTQATPSELTEAGAGTEVVASGALARGPRLGHAATVAIILSIAVPAVVLPLTLTHGTPPAVCGNSPKAGC